MAEFLIAYKITAGNEGGYVNDPHDSGGETYCGISRVNFPHWKGWATIDLYKSQGKVHYNVVFPELANLVHEFYKTNFWDPIDGDNIDDQDVANDAYDMAVNSGVGAAKQMLKDIS